MDALSQNKPAAGHTDNRPQPGTDDIMSSAKVLAEAATAGLHNETDKIDKARVADAAGDILSAASRYGKFEDNTYVEKAETYLHKYPSSHPTNTTTTTPPTTTTTHSNNPSGDAPQSEGGYGEYIKTAQGFLNKPSGGGESGAAGGDGAHSEGGGESGGGGAQSEGSSGDYLKMAQGFLKN